MKKQFTKLEAIELLGQTVLFTETITFGDDEIQIPLVEKGTLADIYLITNQPEGISISALVDDDYVELDREAFEHHCQLVQPEIIDHACSV